MIRLDFEQSSDCDDIKLVFDTIFLHIHIENILQYKEEEEEDIFIYCETISIKFSNYKFVW